jgi:hypothetical protein
MVSKRKVKRAAAKAKPSRKAKAAAGRVTIPNWAKQAAERKPKQRGIMSAKTIAEQAEKAFLAKELGRSQKKEAPIFYDPDKPKETAWFRQDESVKAEDRGESPVMKVVRGLIKDKEPIEEKRLDPASKDVRLRRQSVLEDIEAKREEIRKIPRNGQHKGKLMELSRQITDLKRQLWGIEKELRKPKPEE